MGPWLRRMRVWRAWGAWYEDLLRLSVLVLVVVAFLEAFIGRAIPQAFLPTVPSEALDQLGLFLLNLTVIFVVLVLGLLLWTLRAGARRLPLLQTPIAIIAIAFLVLSLGSSLIRDFVMVFALNALFLAVSVSLLIASAVPSRSPWPWAFAALELAVYGASRSAALASEIGALGAIRVAEAAACLAPIPLFAIAFLAVPRRPRVAIPVLIPTIAALGFALLFIAAPEPLATMAEVALGFTLFLPFAIYVLGLWLAVSSILLLWRDRATAKAYGVALIMIAGIDLVLTHQALLAIAGLLLWAVLEAPREPVAATTRAVRRVPARTRTAESEPAARSVR